MRDGRWNGWIDVLAYSPRTGVLLVIEIKTRLDDVGTVERQLGWYAKRAGHIARELGWRPIRVSPWLLALASDEVDAVIQANRLLFSQAFPRRAADLLNEVEGTAGSGAGAGRDRGPGVAAGVALIDPSSRRRRWIIPSRSDRRRSPAPYRGYADAVRRWEA